MWLRTMFSNREALRSYRGDKLRLARLAQGFSLEELGELLAVTRQNVHKMEAGQEPTEEQLPILCKHLDVKKEYFYSDRIAPVVEEDCHFRSLRSRTKTLTNMVMARAEVLDELLQGVSKYYPAREVLLPEVSDLSFENINDIEIASERLRKEWNIGDAPIGNLTLLAENAGIVIAIIEGVDEKVDAFSISRKWPLIIRNNAKGSPCRYRFDLAHEIGHLVMHSGIQTGDKETEKQASYFASSLLMPRSLFLSAINKYPLLKGARSLNWNSLKVLKTYFGVSLKALLYRAKSLGLISEDRMRSGYIYLNKNGYSKNEPLDDKIPVEEPSLISDLFTKIGPVNWHNLLKEIGLSRQLVSKLFPSIKMPSPFMELV